MGNHGHREQEMPGSRSCPIAEERPWPDEVRSRSALALDAVDLNKIKIQGAIELMDYNHPSRPPRTTRRSPARSSTCWLPCTRPFKGSRGTARTYNNREQASRSELGVNWE